MASMPRSVGQVDEHTVIRATILSTARFMRDNLRSPLVDLGVDLDNYNEEFEDYEAPLGVRKQ